MLHQRYHANGEQMISSRWDGITHGTASSRSALLLVACFEEYPAGSSPTLNLTPLALEGMP